MYQNILWLRTGVSAFTTTDWSFLFDFTFTLSPLSPKSPTPANCQKAQLRIYDGYEHSLEDHAVIKKFCGDTRFYKVKVLYYTNSIYMSTYLHTNMIFAYTGRRWQIHFIRKKQTTYTIYNHRTIQTCKWYNDQCWISIGLVRCRIYESR